MATLNTKTIRWSALRGMSLRDTPQNLPPDIGTDATNVDLLSDGLGRRRKSADEIACWPGSDTGQNIIYHLYTQGSDVLSPSQDYTDIVYAFTIAAGVASLRVLAPTPTPGWAEITMVDAILPISQRPSCASLSAAVSDGVWFYTTAGSAARLYAVTGSSTPPTNMRRVGILQPSAPTVADTGSGSYAATARRYRTSQRLKDGSNIIAESELSAAVSFTPSGSGTAARVTKSATVDSATHWVVWGLISTAGDTYDLYEELAEIVVGTTTYDDSTAPASYDGDFPDPVGLNVPPTGMLYLIATENRLVMADRTQVYFTRVAGSSDRGDLESIPNTTDLDYTLRVGATVNPAGSYADHIVGLGGPVDGIIYVFLTKSIYRLIPTGDVTTPYRVEAVTTQVGAATSLTPSDKTVKGLEHASIVLAEDTSGQPILYFIGRAGAYRISPGGGVEYVGWDVSDPNTGLGPAFIDGRYLAGTQQIVWLTHAGDFIYTYTPRLARLTDQGWRGGWARYSLSGMGFGTTFASGPQTIGTSALGSDQPLVSLLIGGTITGTSTARLVSLSGDTGSDDGTAFTASVTSKPFLLGGGSHRALAQPPIVEAEVDTDATPTINYIVDWGRETQSGATTSLSAVGSETRKVVKAESCQAADAAALQVKVTWDSDQIETIDAVTVPYVIAEPI